MVRRAQARRVRTTRPRPARPITSSGSDAGSGTGAVAGNCAPPVGDKSPDESSLLPLFQVTTLNRGCWGAEFRFCVK